MRYQDAVKKVKLLHPRPGSLIVISVADENDPEAVTLANQVSRQYPLASVALVPSGIGMQELDDGTMDELGWVRKPKVVAQAPTAPQDPPAGP